MVNAIPEFKKGLVEVQWAKYPVSDQTVVGKFTLRMLVLKSGTLLYLMGLIFRIYSCFDCAGIFIRIDLGSGEVMHF